MHEIENKYLRPPTLSQLVEAFAENRDEVIALAYNLEKELSVYDEWIAKNPVNEWFRRVDPRWLRLVDIRKFLKASKPVPESDRLDIPKAKSVPIQDLYDFGKRKGRRVITVSCPFHTDKRPSMAIYTDKNLAVCFSCGFKGDSIDFIQKMYGLSFVDAVKQLTS